MPSIQSFPGHHDQAYVPITCDPRGCVSILLEIRETLSGHETPKPRRWPSRIDQCDIAHCKLHGLIVVGHRREASDRKDNDVVVYAI
jgi:hypothetical protein